MQFTNAKKQMGKHNVCFSFLFFDRRETFEKKFLNVKHKAHWNFLPSKITLVIILPGSGSAKSHTEEIRPLVLHLIKLDNINQYS